MKITEVLLCIEYRPREQIDIKSNHLAYNLGYWKQTCIHAMIFWDLLILNNVWSCLP